MQHWHENWARLLTLERIFATSDESVLCWQWRFHWILKCKLSLAKINNLPKNHDTGAPEARCPMQLHLLHWLKVGPRSKYHTELATKKCIRKACTNQIARRTKLTNTNSPAASVSTSCQFLQFWFQGIDSARRRQWWMFSFVIWCAVRTLWSSYLKRQTRSRRVGSVAIGNTERHVRKASHRGSKQQ